MKKVMAMLVGVAVAGAAVADLSVSFVNAGVGVQDGGAFIPAGSTVQLLWHATGSQTIGNPGGYAVAGGALLPGERLLDEVQSNNDFGFWGPSATLNSDGDINTGIFFTRIFVGDGAAGNFIDVNQVDASLYVYDPGNTATTYSDNATGLAPGSTLEVSGAGTTVIPEPATIGLMGIAGLGMFLARRKARR